MMYYPTSNGIWPNPYQYGAQTTGMQPMYYQMATMPELMTQPTIPTVYYQTPAITTVPTLSQPQPTMTTKTVTTRVLEPTQPPVNATVPEKTVTQVETVRTPSSSSSSSSSSTATIHSDTSTDSTISSRPTSIRPSHPPLVPIHTTALAPVQRVVHRPYTPSGYISSELDYGRRRIYKTDYKYRHYYCCNMCKGRWDLHNRSYSCCEWFYGCPVWSLLICGLLFLGLLAGFFALFGLQPTLNSSRYSETAEVRLVNRTQIIYGFYQNCGYQVNATVDTPTTLILCVNTNATTTARIELSSFYTVISRTTKNSQENLLISFICFIVFQMHK